LKPDNVKNSQAADMKISLPMARQVMLAAQGLTHAAQQVATKADVRDAIRRMGLLQIDTIHVIRRSPYLVLWSRLGDYPPEWLDELLAEGALFEYWAHAMCFLPIEDYPLHRRRMLDAITEHSKPVSWAIDWSQENPEVVERVRAHLQLNGAVRSIEFENKNRPPGGWWNWKEEKNALEALLFTGEVMIARRQNFQRVYDLRERILPEWEDAEAPSSEEMRRTLTLRTVRALGIALPGWVPDYFRQPKKGIAQALEKLAADGLLLKVEVDGLDGPAYIHPDQLELLEQAASGRGKPTLTTLLSPFDPLVWDRERARQLFNFDYTIECYTPAAKRSYGYFTLPILQRGRLIGRLDPKAHRAQGVFEVRALHLEAGVSPSQELAADLATALHHLAAWHGTAELVLRRSNPPELASLLSSMDTRITLRELNGKTSEG
jgi:hypothetical protein